MRQRRRDIHIKGGFFACYSFSAMGAAIADTSFGSDYRLLHGCVAASLLLHVLVVVYVPRVVPLIVAIGQATYAFAPAVFGLIRAFAPQMGASSAAAAPWLFIAAGLIQLAAIAGFSLGRRR